jgi:protein-tyrosine phosphatase
VKPDDFLCFDLLLGMTSTHVRALRQLLPQHADKADLLMRYADGHEAIDVPDPWYGGTQDFIAAFDMIDAGVEGLLAHWAAMRAG